MAEALVAAGIEVVQDRCMLAEHRRFYRHRCEACVSPFAATLVDSPGGDVMLQFPYGIADFRRIRRDAMVYVDRTAHIRDLETLGSILVFLRPRRFGKSLWIQTLATYYDLRVLLPRPEESSEAREIALDFFEDGDLLPRMPTTPIVYSTDFMWQRQRSITFVVLGVLALACRPAGVPERRQTLTWDPEALAHGPAIRWQADVGKGHSEAVVDGDRVCTLGNRRQEEDEDATFYDVVSCRDSATGEVIWEASYPIDDIYFPGPRATPALDGDRLYTLSWAGHVFCFDARDGTVLWSRHLADEGLAWPGKWGFAGSPVIDGSLLILTAGRAGVALDKITGELVWAGEPAETFLPTPIVFDAGDRHLVVLPYDETLYAVDVASGEVQWTFPRDSDFHIAPLHFDGKLFVPGHDGAVLLDVSGPEPKILMEETDVGFSSFQHFAIFENHAYSFSGNNLQCMDITSGRRKWSEELGEYGSLTVVDGMLIVLTGDGELVIAAASPDGFDEISRARVLTLQHYCWTRPVLADSTIYVRDTGGHLVAVDMSW